MTSQVLFAKRFLIYEDLKNSKIDNATATIQHLSPRCYIEEDSNSIYCDNLFVKLNHKESLLLNLFIENRNSVVSYEQIMGRIWGDTVVRESALRTLVYSLRKKLPDIKILSYSKVGYALELK